MTTDLRGAAPPGTQHFPAAARRPASGKDDAMQREKAKPIRSYVPVPYVVERTGRGERSYDIYSRLLRDNIVFIGQSISDELANAVVAQLLFLEQQDPEKEISLYINSPGGTVSAGLAIYDTLQFIRPDVTTYCLGQACSMAALLLAAGTPGKRHTLPNSRVMIHQPLGGIQGQATDVRIHANEIVRVRSGIVRILAHHTGRPESEIDRDIERDRWMDAAEARDYGLVDSIIERRDQPRPTPAPGPDPPLPALPPPR